MKTIGLWFAAIAWLGFQLTAVAAERDRDGFYEPRKGVVERIKRVGVLPLRVPAEIGDREAESAHAEAELTRLLIEAGFEVVSSARYKTSYDEINRRMGGIYDTLTGERDVEKATALLDEAVKSFIYTEKLDGYVQLTVQQRTAQYVGYKVTWDGVTDRTNGKPRPDNSFKTAFKEFVDSQGSLSALSVVVSLRDKERAPMFLGVGGYHTTTYMDPTGSTAKAMFSYVPTEHWVRDLNRMDRALSVATLTLRTTPEQRRAQRSLVQSQKRSGAPAAAEPELPPLPAGARESESHAFDIPRDRILQNVKRVALVPLVLPHSELPADIAVRYQKAIANELEKAGLQSFVAVSLREAWEKELKRTGGYYDGYTGRFDSAAQAAARRSVVEQFARQEQFDTVLWPAVVPRTAEFDGGAAKWDGAKQNAYAAGKEVPWYLARGEFPGGPKGSIDAISLNVELRSKDDKQLYRGLGGIQLTERLPTFTVGNFNLVPLKWNEMFTEPERDTQAAHFALRALALTPEQLEAELNPPKKEVSPHSRR